MGKSVKVGKAVVTAAAKAAAVKAAAAEPAEAPSLVPTGRRGRTDDGTAFMPDPEGGPARIADSLAENLAEEYLESATRGDDSVEEALEAIVPEEIGGPFLETSASDEFADGLDAANPEDAEAEPLPRPVAGLVQPAQEYDEAFAEGEEPPEEMVTAPPRPEPTRRRR
jgi:hypothetical protein